MLAIISAISVIIYMILGYKIGKIKGYEEGWKEADEFYKSKSIK